MRSFVSPVVTRCSNGARFTKMTPVFGAFVNVAPSKPTNATECVAPGRDRMISEARRTTASVRVSVDPGGSCKATIR